MFLPIFLMLAAVQASPLLITVRRDGGVRQSDYDPLLRPAPTSIGQYVVSAWAPLEGRTVNGGVRIAF